MKFFIKDLPAPISNSRGQMTVEAVLILTIMVGIFTMTHRVMKNGDYMGRLVSGPWSFIQGMIENGVWAKAELGRSQHPNGFARRASPKPL